jgi:hypothetical protein
MRHHEGHQPDKYANVYLFEWNRCQRVRLIWQRGQFLFTGALFKAENEMKF